MVQREKQVKCTMKILDEGYRIYPESQHAKSRISEMLKEKKIEHSTYTEKGMRPRMYFARGFPKEMNEEEILELLRKAVTRLKTKFAQLKGIASNCLKIKCVSKRGAGEPIKIKTVDGMRVTLVIFKESHGPVQCYKCQKFGHISTSCSRTQVCVKCAKNHRKEDANANVLLS